MYFSSQSACFSLATGSTLKSATCLQLREWHRLLWSAFLHADETHLYYNMSSFLWKGAQLEPQMGSGGYLVMMTQLLALSQGWMVALAYFSKYWPLLQNMYFSQCTVGFSGVVLNHNSPGWSSVGGVPLPTKYVTWAELVYIQFIAPQASFLGHLSGILAGLTYVTVNHNDLNVFRAVRRLFYMGPRPFSGDGQNASTRTRNTQPDARAAAAAAAVHLSLAGPNAVFVMWATGAAKTGVGALTPNNFASVPSVVRYGTSATALSQTASGNAEVYSQIYNTSVAAIGGATALNYTSPVLHNVRLTGLTPNTQYFYQAGDGTNFSPVFNFTSMQTAGPNYPQRIIAMADWGMSANATSTLQHALVSASAPNVGPPVLYYIADYCYADTWFTNGTVTSPDSGLEGYTSGRQQSCTSCDDCIAVVFSMTIYAACSPAGTWQPVWDSWQRFIQPLVSYIPMLGGTGNHEIEAQSDGNNTVFESVMARWKYPSEASNGSFFYFSSEQGPAHGIWLSPYVDYTPGSDQWTWLAYDLQNIDRTKTPWVIVNIHNPIAGTTDSSYKEFEQMRWSIEPLTYRYGVNVFFYGHVHSYERTSPIYLDVIDPCGAVHITIGDAGNSEGLSGVNKATYGPDYEDTAGSGACEIAQNSSVRPSFLYSNNPVVNDRWSWFKRALTYNADGNSSNPSNPTTPQGYCFKEQPTWSQVREPSFGHGTLDILNATTAHWQWHRNQDGVAIAADDVFIMQDPTACKNRLGQWPIVETGLTGPRVSGSLRQGAAAPAAAPATSLQQTSAAAGRRSLQ
eukprot:jgi/Astpho2/9395/Aster-01660